MEKRGIFILISCMLLITLVYSLNFNDINEVDFHGIFNNTFYNSSGFIQVNTTSEIGEIVEKTGTEDGLISYWRMNESSWSGVSGEVKDVLGNYNGTAINGATTSTGLFGNAGSFDGVDDYFEISNSDDFNPGTQNLTITGWAKSSERGGSNQWHLYVAKRTSGSGGASNGYYMGLYEGNGLNFMVGDGTNRRDTGNPSYGGSGYFPINYDEWFHFAAVIHRGENQIILYVDGEKVANTSISSVGSISNTANLSIGYDKGQSNYPVSGNIDELAFWDRVLSASEILELYQKGNVSSQEGQTTGTYESSVKDASGTANWINFSFNGGEVSGGELPDNQEYDGQVNMSENVLLFHMNELSGTIYDTSGNNNHATQVGGITYAQEGVYETALQFDGTDDYLSIAHDSSLNLGNTLSVEAWIYPTDLSSRPVIYSTRRNNPSNSWQLEVGIGDSNTNIVAVAGVNTWVAETENNAVTLNQWNHIVYTREGTGNTHKIYVNGQLKNLQTQNTYDFVDNSDIKMIGAGTSLQATHFFNGKIDEVAVYNRVLSSDEILERYNRANGTNNNLKFQFRTSNDNISWTEYFGIDKTSSSYYTSSGELNLSNSRYLQYKTYFLNQNSKLYNITINYELLEGISISLDSPENNHLTNEYELNVSCSASSSEELSNVTLYHDKFSWGEVETKSVTGYSDSVSFTISELANNLKWNCYFCNVNGLCSFADSNHTLIIDNTPPTIELISPETNFEFNSTPFEFIFNTTDERAETLNCSLFIDGDLVLTNSSVLSGINTLLSTSLSNGDYTWKINCSDGVNNVESEEKNFSINVLFSPMWAKANTHTHTTESDGSHSPETVVNAYKDAGYNILAITDHNPYGGSYNNYTFCSQYNNLSENFICIESEELTLSSYHLTFVNTKSAWPVSTNSLANVQNGVYDINSQGGFAVVAHPNWQPTNWSINNLMNLQNYTGMEIYNTVIERLQPSPYAVSKWDEVLTQGKKIFGFAADDMHILSSDFGGGWIKVYMNELTNEEFVSKVNQGYFYSSQGPNMDSGAFTLLCDNESVYRMGETGSCFQIKVNATISATNSSYKIQNISLVKGGEKIETKTDCLDEEDCYFEYSEEIASSGYYRLEAIDSNNKWIWSNPIWVNKIALPVTITINSPENNSLINDYTPFLNITLNQETSLWHSVNSGENTTLCNDCSNYEGYLHLNEGNNYIDFFANNSDNILKKERIYIDLDFNKSLEENFSDNSSVFLLENAFFNQYKISLDVGFLEGKFYLKPIITQNNITSLKIEWNENNTENARGEGQREPILARYKFGNIGWNELEQGENWVENGESITDLNNHNLSIMFDFQKNSETPIDLLNFSIIWTEFTVPMISVVSVKEVSSSSAVISWNTDLNSNSSVLYGVTSSLGETKSLGELNTNHSITLTGLNPSTGYFYRVMSCTLDSCSVYPQENFPPYSFTTQSSSSSSSSSSGSSGGGRGGGGAISSSIISGINKLEIQELIPVIINPGNTKQSNLLVTNKGTNFLNDCTLKSNKEYSSWIFSLGTKNLAAGEKHEFSFSLIIPSNTSKGIYNIPINILCQETNKSTTFNVEVIEEKLKFDLLKFERINKSQIKIIYTIEEVSGIEQDVEIEILLFDSNQDKIAEYKGNQLLQPTSINEFETLIPINPLSHGEATLLINLNSETYSSFKEESIILGTSSLTGFSIFDNFGGKDNLISGIIIIAFLIFSILMFRRIYKHKKRKKKSRKMHLLFLE